MSKTSVLDPVGFGDTAGLTVEDSTENLNPRRQAELKPAAKPKADPSQPARSLAYIEVLAEVKEWSGSGEAVDAIVRRFDGLARLCQEQGGTVLRTGHKDVAQPLLRRGVAYAMAAQSIRNKMMSLS